MIRFLPLFIFFILACSKKSSLIATSGKNDHQVSNSEIYYIKDFMDLKGATLVLESKELRFLNGGMMTNGTLIAKNCRISAAPEKIFDKVIVQGNFKGQTGFVEWFLGKNFGSPIENFNALNSLLQVEFTVQLNQFIPIQADHAKATKNPARTIKIIGNDKNRCGLILLTKHENLFYNYFQSEKGFNVVLKNISVITEDYQKGLKSEKEAEYFLFGSFYQAQFNPQAKPSLDSIILDHCNVFGNISLATYGSHSQNQELKSFAKENKIGRLDVKHCTFDNANSPFSFSNMGYDSILILHNQVKNFSSAFLSIPESGLAEVYYEPLRRNKTWVEFSNNVFSNDRVVTVPRDRILSPCVIKGGYGSMLFQNNTLQNLLSDASDSDVHTFYYTCEHPGYFKVINNIIKNVSGKGSVSHPASLVKQRWASNFVLENNDISLDKESLVKIGILKSVKQDLGLLNGHDYYAEFMQVGGQTSFQKKFYIRNNRFSMPLINKSTEIYDAAEFVFEHNTFHIDFFGPSEVKSSVSEDHTFFLCRQRMNPEPGAVAGNFLSDRNHFTIRKTGGHVFNYISFPDGVQVKKGQEADMFYNYENVVLRDSFFVRETEIKVWLPDGKNQLISPVIIGEKNGFGVVDYANSNHLRPNAANYISDIFISNDKIKTSTSPFVFLPGSQQKIEVERHSGDEIFLFNYIYFTSLFNLAKEEDLLADVRLQGIDSQGKSFGFRYFIGLRQAGMSLLIEDEQDVFTEINPAENPGQKTRVKADATVGSPAAKNPVLIVEHGNKHLKEARVKWTNCSQVQSYTIECKILKVGFQTLNKQKMKEKIDALENQK